MAGGLLDFALSDGLQVGRAMMQDVHQEARSLLSALAFCAMGFSVVIGLLGQNAAHGAQTAVRAIVCLVLFDNYDTLFMMAVHLSEDFSGYLRMRSAYGQGLGELFASVSEQAGHTEGIWGQAVDLFRGSWLLGMGIASHWFVLGSLVFITHLTLVSLNLLYVLGPLMIAAGVFCEGASIRRWAHSLFQVFLWPVFPCFVLLVGSALQRSTHLAADNLSATMMTHLVLCLLVAMTPFAVGCLVGRGGVSHVGSLLAGVGMQAAKWGMGPVMRWAGAGAMSGAAGAASGFGGAVRSAWDSWSPSPRAQAAQAQAEPMIHVKPLFAPLWPPGAPAEPWGSGRSGPGPQKL